MTKRMINRRKAMLASCAAGALALASCSGGTTSNATVAQIVASIQTSCGFVTTANAIIPVILSLLSTFDAAAGAGATVASDLAKQVVDAVCMAVKEKAPTPQSLNPSATPGNIVVVVNGVQVPGHLVGPKTMTYKQPA